MEDETQTIEVYEPPALTEIGKFDEVTLGPCCGGPDSFGHFFF
ncbi:lasso RiPP family leader peptide-containing protein [Streptomyces parvus]